MTSSRFDIPLTSTLLAFEAVGRLGGVGPAARERKTAPSAISRHIRKLERDLGFRLFCRTGRGLALTESGNEYFAVVQTALEDLHATSSALRTRQINLVIGCTQEFAGLVLLPIFSRLKRSLGEEVAARIVIYDEATLPLLVRAGLDIIVQFSVHAGSPEEDAVKIFDEEVVPVASPVFLQRYGTVLARHPQHWIGVPRLDVGRRDPAWASWEDWFDAHGCTPPDRPAETFDNHIHVLRAAAEGGGLAMGWNGFMTDYIEAGRLVAVRGEWLRTKRALYGVRTPSGRRNRASTHGLRELARLAPRQCSPMPPASGAVAPLGKTCRASRAR